MVQEPEGSQSSGPSMTAGSPVNPGSAYPRAFGEYLLLASFGRGGMGEVYLAKRGQIEGIDHLCVLKRLRADLSEEEEYVRRFIDEARLVVQLSHGNICHVFDVGRVGTDHFLAMEYIAGVNLRTITDCLAGVGETLDQGLALFLVSEMLEALDYAHRYKAPVTGEPINLVHRDVSPHNIMMSFEGEAKLIDFGLADSELKAEKTESHVVMGKVSYMSPEQARGDEVSGATDQFAIAIILYELLSNHRFYGTRRIHEIWQLVGLGGFLPDPLAELPEELQAILKRALAAQPRDRYDTCEAFRDDLIKVLHRDHPGVGKRQFRELMQRVCTEDIERHRKVLTEYQDLSARSAVQSLETTQSFASRSSRVSDERSLPTGVVPASRALAADPFRSETEETATATAFMGVPKVDQDSVAAHAVPGPAWARPMVIAALLAVGVFGGLFVHDLVDNSRADREIVVVARHGPEVDHAHPAPGSPAVAPGGNLKASASGPPLGSADDDAFTGPHASLNQQVSVTDDQKLGEADPLAALGASPSGASLSGASLNDATQANATNASKAKRRRARATRRGRESAAQASTTPAATPFVVEADANAKIDRGNEADRQNTVVSGGQNTRAKDSENSDENEPGMHKPLDDRRPYQRASLEQMRDLIRVLGGSPLACAKRLANDDISDERLDRKRILIWRCAQQSGATLPTFD